MMKNVLIIDDNEAVTDVVKLMLQSSGYNCTIANSAKNSFDIIRKSRFDLILLDVAMPEFNGIDLLKQLKGSNILHHNRIVFFSASAFTDEEMADLMQQYGVLDYIRKPVTKAKLLQVLTRCMEVCRN
jgi:CheY-like chemotaxis protein